MFEAFPFLDPRSRDQLTMKPSFTWAVAAKPLLVDDLIKGFILHKKKILRILRIQGGNPYQQLVSQNVADSVLQVWWDTNQLKIEVL